MNSLLTSSQRCFILVRDNKNPTPLIWEFYYWTLYPEQRETKNRSHADIHHITYHEVFRTEDCRHTNVHASPVRANGVLRAAYGMFIE